MTNNELIKKALQELGVIAFNGTATNSQAQDVLSILNGMMAQWEQTDKALNWFPQDTLSATVPIPAWAENGVISNLAIEASAAFRAPVSVQLAEKADKGRRLIAQTLIKLKNQGVDMDHIHLGSYRSHDILTDS